MCLYDPSVSQRFEQGFPQSLGLPLSSSHLSKTPFSLSISCPIFFELARWKWMLISYQRFCHSVWLRLWPALRLKTIIKGKLASVFCFFQVLAPLPNLCAHILSQIPSNNYILCLDSPYSCCLMEGWSHASLFSHDGNGFSPLCYFLFCRFVLSSFLCLITSYHLYLIEWLVWFVCVSSFPPPRILIH